jgi:CBS domain-containing membrane protein
MKAEPTVSDIMTRQVVALLEEQNLAQILATFERFTFHHLPVLDDRKVVGMVSHRDVLRATVAGIDKSAAAQAREERFVERTFVRDLMTTTVLTVGAHDSVREAASRMLEARVDSLPVVDEAGNMTGIVTAHDILAMVRDDR